MTVYSRISLETVVNSATSGSQISPSVAGFSTGGFVATWLTGDSTQDGSGQAIKAQRYDASGAKIGGEFLVNTLGVGDQTAQSVTTMANGGFVVTWQTSDTTQDGSGSAIKAQVFDANGLRVGSEFLVETQATSNQSLPSVTSLTGGDFVIAWGTSDTTQDGVGSAIKAQRYSSTGATVGSEFLVNSMPSAGSEGRVTLTGLASGGFAATYSVGSGALGDVYARIFDAAGNPLGASFLASTATQYNQNYCTAVQLANGNILLSWASVIDTSNVFQQRAQLLSATGTKIGAEFTLAGTAGLGDAKVVALLDGGFAAAWTPGIQSLQDGNTLLRLYNADGSARGEAEIMNVGTTSFEGYSALAIDGNGTLFAGWSSTTNSDNNIAAQILVAHAGPLITSNGGGGLAPVSAAENQQQVTTIVATNPNAAAQLTYSIVGGGEAAQFAINATTGVLTFVSAPNFESPTTANGVGVYYVTVRASDGTYSDVQQLAVTVTNVNEAPFWGFYSGNYNVAENTTVVGTFTAFDFEQNPVSYSLAGTDAARFAINQTTGALSFVCAPDYEVPGDNDANNVYSITLLASDGSLTSSKALTVTVTDANEAPLITSNGGGATASVAVSEGTGAVTTVISTDPEGNVRTYSIAGGADAARFAINSATGALSFVAAPNYEAPTDSNGDNAYEVTVRASDGSLTDTQGIFVSVTNVNEAPVISSGGGGDSATLAIGENTTAVNSVTSSDPEGTAPTYAITGGIDAARFTIDAATGALSFVAAPNFEAPADANGDNVYQVIVLVSDGSLSDSQALSVTVTNVNEAPAITSATTFSLAENGTAAALVSSTDPEVTPRSYAIVGGADAARFTIVAASGVLSFVAAPDYEVPADADMDNIYQVSVRASDGSLSDTQALSIAVTNLDEAPIITSNGGGDTATIGVAENATAVALVAASDPENSSRTFAIAGGADAAKFAIDATTGALTFIAAPDFDAPGDANADNAYEVVVSASDGAFVDTQALSVVVGNVNEGPALVSGAGFAASENVLAAGVVRAADPDGDSLTYAIAGGADAAKFAIDAATGALSFIAAPNFEAPGDADGDNVYQVSVSASDGALTTSQAVTVTVGNVDEAPEIAGTAFGAVENGLAAGTLAASDPDGATLSYAIIGGNDAARFAVDAVTGALSFVTAPNYEAPGDSDGNNVYEFVVRVSDGTLATVRAVTVTVANADEAPVISSQTVFTVYENATPAGAIMASDPESAPVTYAIGGGADAAGFAIDAATGELSFLAAPNFEAAGDANGDNLYEVIVFANDGILTSSQAITVAVSNVNEAPTITSASTFSLAENGTAVATVTSTDPEGTARTYTIAGGADAAKFAIDALTGALTFVAAPNFEAPSDANGDNVYQVIVSASDGALSDTQTLNVTVTNLNEAPTITSASAFSLNENGTSVATVTSTDPEGTPRSYAIAGGADAARFAIDAATGALSFVAAPNFEAPSDANGDNVYQVVVSANDGSLNDTRSLAITVTNVNEAPTITSASAFSVAENGTSVATVTSTDPEATERTYAIAGGVDAAKFVINSSTGALSFIAAPNFEAPTDANGDNVYQVVVSASDGSLSDSQSLAITVTNVSEAPTITSNGGGGTATVTVGENSSAVTTVTSTDPEGTARTYAIVGGADSPRFTVNASTGALSFVAAPNFEAPTDANADNVYQVVVSASDGSLSDSQTIAVTVANVNEAPTITSNGGGDSANITINENALAVTTVTSTDPEGVARLYSISGGTDAAKFSINATTGALAFAAAPNFEAPTDANGDNVYNVIVTASDGSLSDSQTIAVTVANVIDGITLTGTTKADTLTGGAAEDTINGLGGNDTLSGGGGADTIDGGDGADNLIGGAGADRLTGGAGADTFTYNALSDSSAALADFLTDFSTAQGDKIGLSAIDANTVLAGDQAFSWIGTSAFSGVAGQLRYYQSGGDTFVTGDVNGDGLGDFLIQIDPLVTLAPNNFFL